MSAQSEPGNGHEPDSPHVARVLERLQQRDGHPRPHPDDPIRWDAVCPVCNGPLVIRDIDWGDRNGSRKVLLVCDHDEGTILKALGLRHRDLFFEPDAKGDQAAIADSSADEHFELAVMSARDLCALPDPPGAELLGPLIVRGNRTVIGAATGEGKTTLMMGILRAVIRSEELLGFRGAGDCRALFIDAEQGQRTIKRRLAEAGLSDAEDLDVIRVPDGLSLDRDKRHVAALDAVLAAGNYGLVVPDPLYKLHAGDSNDERQAVDLMRTLDALRERHNFALGLTMHLRKPPIGAKFTLNEFFGSTAYLRGAEVVLGLQRVRDGYARLHFFKDRDGDLPIGHRWGLLFDRERGFRRDPDDEKPKQTAAEVVAELLERQPDMSTEQLVAASTYTDRTVRAALKKLGASDKRPGAHGEKLWNLGGGGDQ